MVTSQYLRRFPQYFIQENEGKKRLRQYISIIFQFFAELLFFDEVSRIIKGIKKMQALQG